MTGQTDSHTQWRDLLAGGHLFRFCIICLGVWLHAADSLLVATVMPSAVAEIGGVPYVSWAIALYQLGSIVAGATAGLLTVRYGVRNAMVGSGLLYAVGCVASALAPDIAIMLGGRILQGLGGGALVALAFVAASQLFPERLWPRLMAIISAVWGASAFCGPLIGGVFASAGIWRGSFWAFAAQAVVLCLGALFFLSGRQITRQTAAPAVPVVRIAVLALAIFLVAMAATQSSAATAAAMIVGAVALIAIFLRLDDNRPDRLFPSHAIDLRFMTGAGLVMVFAFAAATISFTTYGPLLMTHLFGADPLVAGYLVAAESIAWTVAAILCSGAGRSAEVHIVRFGSAMITVGLLGFAIVMPHGPLLALLPWAIMQGSGFGMAWAFVTRRIIAGAPAGQRETASSSVPTVQLIGYAIGAALSGVVANLAGFADGISPAAVKNVGFWVFAAFLPLALLGNLAAWRLVGNSLAPAPR